MLQLKQVPARARAPRPPPVVGQMNHRRTSQPTPGDVVRQSTRRFSDNGATASGRERRRNDQGTGAQSAAYGRRQSVQSTPPPTSTVRDRHSEVRRSSEGPGVTQADAWWTRPPARRSADTQQYRKRCSVPEVALARSYRRESTGSTSRERDSETAGSRRRRWNAWWRLADESFDSALTSGLPSSGLPSPSLPSPSLPSSGLPSSGLPSPSLPSSSLPSCPMSYCT